MIQPIRTNVLVKPLKGNNVTDGGLFIPDNCVKESNKVEIVAVGNGTKDKPMTLKSGQIGFRVKDWGTPVIENGELYYLMEQDAIIATD